MKACMTPDEWAEWSRLNDIQPAANRATDPCEDCTVRFAVLMRLERRCDGWPTVPVGGRPIVPVQDVGQDRRRRQWREAQERRRMRLRVTA